MKFNGKLNLNTVSLRHKHSLDTLIIHINQCIHIVLAFSGNGRQSILHLKYCFRQKFIYKNFIFEIFIFRKFYLIASLKSNGVSPRHKHSLEILFTYRKKKFHTPRNCIYRNCNINIPYIESYTRKFLKFLNYFFFNTL